MGKLRTKAVVMLVVGVVSPLSAAGWNDPADLIDDRYFAATTRPAQLPAGEWELTSKVEVVTTIDGVDFSDRARTHIIGAMATGRETKTRICIGAGGDGAGDLFTVPASDCDSKSVAIAAGEVKIRQHCVARKQRAAVSVDGRYSADGLIAFTEARTPIATGGFVLLQSTTSGKLVGACDRAAFVAKRAEVVQ